MSLVFARTSRYTIGERPAPIGTDDHDAQTTEVWDTAGDDRYRYYRQHPALLNPRRAGYTHDRLLQGLLPSLFLVP